MNLLRLHEKISGNSLETFFKYVDVAVKRIISLNSVPTLTEHKVHAGTVGYFTQPPFQEWLRSHNVLSQENPPYKEGGQGTAYFVGNEKVVKFITDEEDAEMAALCVESRIPSVTIQEIVRVGKFWALMQEEVLTSPFPAALIDAGSLLKIYIKENILNPDLHKMTPQDVYRHVNKSVAAFPEGQMAWYKTQMKKMEHYVVLIMKSVTRILDHTGRLWLDPNYSNFGFSKEGMLKIFDIGLSAQIWHVPIPKIRRIV